MLFPAFKNIYEWPDTWQSPRESLIGSPVSSSTFIMAMGYTAGMILETNPIAPGLLSMFTERKKIDQSITCLD